MLTSVNWMNEYLDPPASAAEQGELLTRAGFPLEASEALSGSDVRQDYEMTSNRGDCVCHVGLAREIAAISGRTLRPPRARLQANGPPADGLVSVTNERPDLCPLYTARLITGAKVAPSPDWLAERLRAIKLIPRNNIVDASNFVLYELGQPTHVFDLARLAGPQIIIRPAVAGERFLPIGEGAPPVTLTNDDLVIADAEVPVAIAGVKGGALTAVSSSTTDLLLEAATFAPAAVRRTGRRHNIESDSAYRFERGVPAGQVEAAAERLAELILELAGGTLAKGAVADGAPLPKRPVVTMRADRCRAILGADIPTEKMIGWLAALELKPAAGGDTIRCTVPVHRLDIEREIDLIEEVGRMMGHDTLPVEETIRVRVAPLQPAEMARRAVNDALVGMGFIESITHGLIPRGDAEAFLPAEAQLIEVEGEPEAARQAGTVLRPSILPSLLRVLAHNHDNGVEHVRFFESAATFLARDGSHEERLKLAMVADLDDRGEGLRGLRGCVERLVGILLGPAARVEVHADAGAPWLAPGGVVAVSGPRVRGDEARIGRLGVIGPQAAAHFQLAGPVAGAELDLEGLWTTFPPETEAHELPSYPAVERDVSVIVPDDTAWAALAGIAGGLDLEHLEAVEFVSTYRGPQITRGCKSVTMRLRFRAPDRTLVHESVDAQVAALVTALESRLGAEIRGLPS